MKRHPALHDLSRDHHLLLLQSRQIRWAAASDDRAPPWAHVIAEFLSTWHSVAVPHMREEETVFLPRYGRFPSPTQRAHEAQVRADHAWLRAQAAEVERRHAADEPLRELLALAGRLLHDHIRFEERVVFPHVQRVMPDDALLDLGDASRRFRETHRPHAIGPR